MLNGQDVRRYATNGDLLPLDHIPYKDRFQRLAIDTYTIRGHLWGVPLASTGGFNIMTNTYLLDKVGASYPKTYAELVAVGKKLQKIGVSAFSHPGKFIYLWPVWFFTTYAQTTHNQSVQKTIDTLRGKGKFTDPEVVQALELIFRFSKDGLFSPDVLSLDTNGTEHEFLTGKAAFAMGDYGFSSTLRQQKVPNTTCAPSAVSRRLWNAGLAVTPDGRQVWVPCGGAASLAVIDTRTNGASQTLFAGLMPHAVAFAPEGRTVYMTDAGQQTLVSLERASGAVRARVPIGTGAAMVALRPDGGRVYVTGQSGSVLTLVCWR
jgi:ABC-type glycerol-3-phosphate transport system substrate-binding protein